MVDVTLVRMIRDEKYDPWSEPLSPHIDRQERYALQSFTTDPEFRYIRSKRWRRVVAWDLGKLGEPNVMVTFKYRYIETAWGESSYPGIPRRYCVTPVYHVSGVRESHDDYSAEVENLQKRFDPQTLPDVTLVYDATGSGSAVSQQIRHLQGFRRIVPIVFTTGTEIKRQRGFVVEGRSALLADLEQVVKQRRIRIPGDKRFDKLTRQLAGIKVEETVQGYYRRIDNNVAGQHHDVLLALGMGITYVETIGGRIAAGGGY